MKNPRIEKMISTLLERKVIHMARVSSGMRSAGCKTQSYGGFKCDDGKTGQQLRI